MQANPTRAKRTLLSGVAVVALSAALAATANAQNSKLDPTFGTFSEVEGFGSFSLTIQAGGTIDLSDYAPGCSGFVAEAPDIVFDYDGQTSVFIEAQSNADTTMMVEAPDGQILCNDDFNELNAGLQTSSGEPGRYAVWVGTFDPIENNTYPDADISVREATDIPADDLTTDDVAPPVMPSQDIAASGFNALEAPTFGEITVTAGFGSQVLALQAGGMVDAFTVNEMCAGFVADVPDYVVNFQDAGSTLNLNVLSDVDTTLVVVGPDGTVNCNDDDVDLNPGLSITQAIAGTYAVFVGTFNPIENDFYPDAQLTVASGQSAPTAPTEVQTRAALEPTFGAIDLSSGFGSHAVDIEAGGFEEASSIDVSCTGFVAEAPDYVVRFGGGDNLRIAATSEADTTMVVVTPGGEILCNDDSNGLNPGLVTSDGAAGNYAIWIGTYEPIQNDVYPATTITVDEVSTDKDQPAGAITSTSLTAGFEPDPFVTVLAAGGVIDAGTIDGFCNGNIAVNPDFVLDYTSGDWPLRFLVTSDADTTLLVRTPGGEVLCNDDSDGLNPGLSLTSPSSGQYEVFIGTFDPTGGFPEATLAITELLDEKILPDGAVTQMELNQGATRQDFDLLAGGAFDAFETFGGSCNGFVAGNPDFLATVSDGGVDVELTVRSAEDTTLVVRGPDGRVSCDDDSGGDLNPLVLLETAQTGTYEVWLGTFSSVSSAPATLSLRDINADASVAPNVPGGGKK